MRPLRTGGPRPLPAGRLLSGFFGAVALSD